MLNTSISDELFNFCTTECSTVADELSLDAYMGLVGRAADSDVGNTQIVPSRN